jgi:LysR family carnitine catabolism transcriptional activator
MEIAQIEAFERVAREGNFTRAADSLGLTQPAVSTRIALLEAELGGALFERQGRQLRLTPMGEQFLPYAQRLLAVLADSRQAVESFRKGRLGAVKIAAPTPFILSFLVETLSVFRRAHPAVDVLIRERDKTTIFRMLADGVIHLGLVNAPVFDRRFMQIAHFQDPIRAVVAPGHPLAGYGTQPVPMEVLYKHTIFRVSMFPAMTAFIDAVVEQSRVGSGGAVIAVPMVMALQLVAQGQGVTFLPDSYVRGSIKARQLVYLPVESMPRLLSEPVLITQKDRSLDSSHLAFVAVLKQRWQHLMV